MYTYGDINIIPLLEDWKKTINFCYLLKYYRYPGMMIAPEMYILVNVVFNGQNLSFFCHIKDALIDVLCWFVI